MNIRGLALGGVLAAVSATLIGCSQENPGEAEPGQTVTNTAASSSAESSPAESAAPTAGSGPLATVDPCRLITVAEGRQFGITNAEHVDVTRRARYCRYSGSGFLISIAIAKDIGLNGYNDVDGKLTKTSVNGRPALFQKVNGGGCTMAIGFTDTTSVDIRAEYGTTPAGQKKACAVLPEIVGIVEPKLQP